MIPVLMISYNRLEFTKQALAALLVSDCGEITLIDNGSTDGTMEWLRDHPAERLTVISNERNLGIAGAMNIFLGLTQEAEFVAKVDNDTVVPRSWIRKLLSKMIIQQIDIIQAKHSILKATHPGGFDEWIKSMHRDDRDPSIYYNHFVGGSGIIFRRNIVKRIPETDWMLGGWREFQRQHPELRKAFCSEVEISLLDTNENGADYSMYPDYYKETKRAV